MTPLPRLSLEHFILMIYRVNLNTRFLSHMHIMAVRAFCAAHSKQKKLFIKKRNYEPWLSMELIPYKESRDYGLRVLANYIVYQGSFGNHINLEDYLKQTLVN